MKGVHLSKKLVAMSASCVAAIAALGWSAWIVFEDKDQRTQVLINDQSNSPELGRAAAIGGIKSAQAVDLPMALLGDYYEHVIEHAPPRNPRGVMQRRERFYRAPADPFDLIRSSPPQCEADALLREGLDRVEAVWTHGEPIQGTQMSELEGLAGRSSLTARKLMSCGRAMDFLVGDHLAASFFRAALRKSQVEFKHTPPGDPAAVPFLHELDQTVALWRLKDYAALDQRFGLAARLYPALSIEARRAGCLEAMALYNQGLANQSAERILQVLQQDNQVGDLGVSDPSDLPEMDWETGLYLAAARRYEEAIPYYRDLLRTNDSRKPLAARYLISCLRHVGKDKEADEIRSQYHLASSPPTTGPTARGA